MSATTPKMILEKSVVNCHVKGLHSVVLQENPMVRIFFTTPEHRLNHLQHVDPNHGVAFHPHHCDITLIPLFGYVVNVVEIPASQSMFKPKPFCCWTFDSKLAGGKGGFIADSDCPSVELNYERRQLVLPQFMSAHDIHTVLCFRPRNAWMVVEGRECPIYRSTAYSNADLTKWDTSELYQPMTEEFVEENLWSVYRKVLPLST